MPETRATAGPAPDKQRAVVRTLRGHILDRKAWGEKLPTIRTLCNEFGVATVTMQKSLDHLKREALIHGLRGSGLYVADDPPHRRHVALVFPSQPGNPGWSMFARALHAASKGLVRSDGMALQHYFCVTAASTGGDTARLQRDLDSRRLRGVIFVTHPNHLAKTSLVGPMPVPRVGIMSQPKYPHVGALHTDWEDFTHRGLEHFGHLGRKRVGIITTSHDNHAQLGAIRKVIDASHFTFEPYWVQMVPRDKPEWAANAAHAMFVHSRRPDALFAMDDHIVTPVLDGLRAAGRRLGSDVHVIAHCNFPNPTQRRTGVRYLGFSASDLLHAGIDQLLSGDRYIAVRPVFQNEFTRRARHGREGTTHA